MADITVDKLNQKEKIHMMAGSTFWSFGDVERLSLPALKTSDASNGIRQQYKDEGYSSKVGSMPAICYPSLCACGCSFDAELVYEMGRALGEECRSRGIAVLLGPGINIKRNPLCGRNFEYISEDPVLSGKLGAAFINGVQSVGVAACLKHFALNNQETRRTNSNSIADGKTMWEIYLRNFEIAVKEGRPWVIMGAYNKLNGIYCCENSWLLNDILRNEWGFDGVTVSDWGGVNDIIRSFNNGLDVEMPGGVNNDEDHIEKCANTGELKQEAMDRAAADILRLSERTRKVSEEYKYEEAEHLDIARKVAESSFVLLKNDGDMLPIKKDAKILVVGELAKRPRYQGHGSGKVKLSYAETPWASLKGYFPNIRFEPGYSLAVRYEDDKSERAYEACGSADIVLFFAGQLETGETEGFDRADMKLPTEQNKLIKAIARRNKNIAVIVQGGSPVEMLWRSEVRSVLMCYFSGSCFGSALLNILNGTVSPSGKLAETLPDRLSDVPSYEIYPAYGNAVYKEGCEVGYRFYNKYGIDTAYPFGFGLSYTGFDFYDISAEMDGDKIKVRCSVKNTGKMSGKAVLQIYIKEEQSEEAYELAAFDKFFLEAGEEKTVETEINTRYVSRYDQGGNACVFEKGSYEICAGYSSAEMAAKTVIKVDESIIYPFEADSRGRIYFEGEKASDGITLNTTLREFEHKKIMKPVIGAVKMISRKIGTDLVPADRVSELVMDTPLRHLPMGTNGAINLEHVKKAVKAVNAILGKRGVGSTGKTGEKNEKQ